jgi:hypothetical protein
MAGYIADADVKGYGGSTLGVCHGGRPGVIWDAVLMRESSLFPRKILPFGAVELELELEGRTNTIVFTSLQ